jgi:serine protease Do
MTTTSELRRGDHDEPCKEDVKTGVLTRLAHRMPACTGIPARGGRWVSVLLLTLMCGALQPVMVAAQAGAGIDDLAQFSDALEALSDTVGKAVVQVLVSGYGPGRSIEATTGALIQEQRGTGSGVVLDPAGYIVTNAHVVAGARRVQVIVPDEPGSESAGTSILTSGGRLVGAQIVGLDRETDLAVLKVNVKGLAHLELGDSDELRQGELVMAFGSPLGLSNSASMGVVSSVARQLRPGDPMIYIQTDAAINPGNSGGPLVDSHGRVMGINTMILSQSGGSEGIGFAAPSNIVKNVYEQIRSRGHVKRGEIGVNAQTITPLMAAGLGLARTSGVVLGDVYPQGPAAEAGLHIGDVVLTLDGKPMENGRQFEVNLYNRQPGERVSVEVMRGKEKKSFRIQVRERKEDPSRFVDMVTRDRNLIEKLGILALDIDERIQRALPPLRIRNGVVVAARAVDAPFWNEGLLPGDVIHKVNGREVQNLAQLRTAMSGFGFGDAVVLQIERYGQLRYVEFQYE